MKYDRLTISPSGSFTSAKNVSVQRLIDRLVVLENKIENGELISTIQSEQGEQEIAYFVKHNAAVRKQAVKEFSDKILSVSKITFSAFTDARIALSLAEYKQLVKEVCGE